MTADVLTLSVAAAVASTAVSTVSSLIDLVKRGHSSNRVNKESKDALVSINMPNGDEVHLKMTVTEARALSQSHQISDRL